MPAMANPPTILRVAIPSPLYRCFDYLPPQDSIHHPLQPGMRLRLPFGRGQAVGILLEVADHSTIDHQRLRPAAAVLDQTPLIPPDLLNFLRWAANYYHHPLGEVIAAALPTRLRQGEAATPGQRSRWYLSEAGAEQDTTALARRATRQATLLQRLRANDNGLADDDLDDGADRKTLNQLCTKGWARIEQIPDLKHNHAPSDIPPLLNPAQAAAVDAVCSQLDKFTPFLLDGVTGSGKTEVYLRVIDQVLAAGRQTLVLVPEITLTPQLLSRFERRFSAPLAVLHSGLGEQERQNAWLYAATGEAKIIIGTRSAVFTPLAKPGVIIVDEEHDASFKQQSGFRYSARDLALVRAQQLNIPIVLGSATPSFESLLNVKQARYQRLHLPDRAGSAQKPRVELLDLRRQVMQEQLSEPLLQRMQRHLAAGGQVLLFLNRRGFAPTLICHECGWTAECRRCDAHMTLHQQQRHLRCHHCGSQRPLPQQCPSCGSADLRAIGSGTERIEQTLQQHFPEIGICRIDRDSTRRKGSLEQILSDIHDGRSRILIGTQMLAKGHHFPDVTLVGILDGDQGLFGIDFRAGERMAQMIVQVSGRAGRAERPGEVVIQTHHPDHPLLQRLCREGYHAFAEDALAERETAALPPYQYLAVLRAEASQHEAPLAFLEQAQALAIEIGLSGVELFGPLPAPMERRAGKFRAQLLLQAPRRAALHKLLDAWTPRLSELSQARKVRMSLDVDPIDLL